MRLATCECRWFVPGALSDAPGVERAFRAAGDWDPEGEVPEPSWPRGWREDRYLLLPTPAAAPEVDVGVKLRAATDSDEASRFEFKARSAILGQVDLGAGARGAVERWIKWSYTADEVPGPLWSGLAGGLGIAVRKRRLLRVVRLDPSGLDREVPAGTPRLDRALELELTEVELADDSRHWTVGLEAFPPDPGMHEGFLRNAGLLAAALSHHVELTAERSMSYPEWLRRQEASP